MALTIEQMIEKYTNENGFSWGINTVMDSLRPNCLYSLSVSGGQFIIVDWPENQWSSNLQSYILPPSSQEIRDEYIRQQTVAECYDYLVAGINSKKRWNFLKIFKGKKWL